MNPTQRAICLTAVVLMAATPTLLAGQVGDSVRLAGRVLESESEVPIGFADVVIYDRDLRSLRRLQTDDDGNFAATVPGRKQGVYLEAERIGYRGTRTPFLWFDDHAFFRLEIRLDREAILLAPLEVVTRFKRENPMLVGFRRRVQRGLGVFITREQIEEANPQLVTDLLARIPGVRLRSAGDGVSRVVQMSRKSILACPAQVYVDGVRLNSNLGPRDSRLVAIDEYVSPNSVEGIEVYQGRSTVPAVFLNRHSDCGVVVIWTRRGG